MAGLPTRVTQMLGIEVPILGFSHSVDVTAAISRAGGYGVYGVAHDWPDDIPQRLAQIAERAEGRPFGVDMLYAKGMPSDTSLEQVRADLPAAHRAFVDDLRRKYAVPAATRKTFYNSILRTPAHFDAQLDAILASEANCVAFGIGCTQPLVERVKSAGKHSAALIGSPRHVRPTLETGVDIIVAQGSEAGGHTGDIGTLTLVPQVVAAADQVPVVAAGGIGHGSQIAAALALGADGVWLGTKWLATAEHAIHSAEIGKLLAAGSDDTMVTRGSSGKPQRQVRSAWSEAWADPAAPRPLPMPYQHALVGDLLTAIEEHAVEPLVHVPAGQSVAWCDRVQTVADVVAQLTAEAAAGLQRAATLSRPA